MSLLKFLFSVLIIFFIINCSQKVNISTSLSTPLFGAEDSFLIVSTLDDQLDSVSFSEFVIDNPEMDEMVILRNSSKPLECDTCLFDEIPELIFYQCLNDSLLNTIIMYSDSSDVLIDSLSFIYKGVTYWTKRSYCYNGGTSRYLYSIVCSEPDSCRTPPEN